MGPMVAGDIRTETLVDSRATEKGNIDVLPEKNLFSYTQNIGCFSISPLVSFLLHPPSYDLETDRAPSS